MTEERHLRIMICVLCDFKNIIKPLYCCASLQNSNECNVFLAVLIIVKYNSWYADPVSSAGIRLAQYSIRYSMMAITLSLVALHE